MMEFSFKGTVTQIEKALVNNRLRVSKLRWLVGLKLIQQKTNTTRTTTSSNYFSEKFKTNTLQGHKRSMKIFEFEINNLRIQILVAKMT